MIKKATHEDIVSIVEMCRSFAQESGLPLNEHDLTESLIKWIDGIDSVIFISEFGMIAASIGELFFNKKIRIAQEHMWWVKREHRKSGVGESFLASLESWAYEKGANAVLMVAMMSSNPEKAESIYSNRNYIPFERSFIKYL